MTNVLRLIVIIATMVQCGTVAQAQQGSKIPTIGFLVSGTPSELSPRIDAFRQGL